MKKTIEKITTLLATGLGSGYSPKAPGTVGSFIFLILWLLYQTTEPTRSLTIDVISSLALSIIALISIYKFLLIHPSKSEKDHDPQCVVIDEWAGLYISLILVPIDNVLAIIVAFTLFRFFDATKLPPVSWGEKLPGALGILLDDIIAGVISSLIVVFFVL